MIRLRTTGGILSWDPDAGWSGDDPALVELIENYPPADRPLTPAGPVIVEDQTDSLWQALQATEALASQSVKVTYYGGVLVGPYEPMGCIVVDGQAV